MKFANLREEIVIQTMTRLISLARLI